MTQFYQKGADPQQTTASPTIQHCKETAAFTTTGELTILKSHWKSIYSTKSNPTQISVLNTERFNLPTDIAFF